MSKKTTMKDIAKIANVSEATVSLVLNKRPSRISEAKKCEILKIAKELNYRPNHIARFLSIKKTNTIGLIIPDIENPYFSSMCKHIEDYIRTHNYLLFIVNSDDNFDNDIALFNELISRRVDGLLICPSNESYHHLDVFKDLLIKNSDVPLVFIDRSFDFDINSVVFDNEYGAYLATKYLIENNCKKIACITGNQDTYNGKKRLDGYIKALKEYNIEINYNLIFEGNYKFQSGYAFKDKIIESNVDGVFCCNDLMAYGLMRGLSDKKNIPMIVGYDNLKENEMFETKLTSVSQDIEKLAVSACDLLMDNINHINKRKNIVLKPSLSINGNIKSCGDIEKQTLK